MTMVVTKHVFFNQLSL